jgi:hypothetical protein
MNAADAICSNDIDGGDCEPMDECIGCGTAIAVGQLRCVPCQDAADEREEFEINGRDERDPRH